MNAILYSPQSCDEIIFTVKILDADSGLQKMACRPWKSPN